MCSPAVPAVGRVMAPKPGHRLLHLRAPQWCRPLEGLWPRSPGQCCPLTGPAALAGLAPARLDKATINNRRPSARYQIWASAVWKWSGLLAVALVARRFAPAVWGLTRCGACASDLRAANGRIAQNVGSSVSVLPSGLGSASLMEDVSACTLFFESLGQTRGRLTLCRGVTAQVCPPNPPC